ncbi:uncharacterized protein RSE6_01147 [Rhynchosporium secalis]|uniref:Uncharacterized protein n=1 Tax=Rhynchosporium secalis TaxID=38038 RepID=A0A1E1LX35_RHYSE|nr:uncharacterized protein RSE6_01147 [Rhynchosporium secalis]
MSRPVLASCTSAQLLGITGPKYRSVRDDQGLKHILLSNSLAAVPCHEHVPFISSDDLEMYKRLDQTNLNAMTCLNELIGHECGRLIQKDSAGNINFDMGNIPLSPFTGLAIKSGYAAGEIPKSVFGGMYNALNECLAESIALVLMKEEEVLEALGVIQAGVTAKEGTAPTDEDYLQGRFLLIHGTVLYNAYLQIIWLALNGLASCDPEKKVCNSNASVICRAASQKSVLQTWAEAHDRARFGILKTLLLAVPSPLKIRNHPDGEANLTTKLSNDLVYMAGHRAVSDLATHLHVYKCTADFECGRDYFESITTVDGLALTWRDAAMVRKKPRPLFVMGNTFLETGEVRYQTYPATREGLIQSWADRGV